MTSVGTLSSEAGPGTGSAPNGRRVIRRRRGLPGSRAVVGSLLVTSAAVGLYAAYAHAAAGPTRAFVVVQRSIPVGARLEAADLARVRMELPRSLQARAFDDPRVLFGATVLGPMSAGELVQAGSVVRTHGGPGDQELTLAVERSRSVAGLRDGERIDVLVTYGSGADAYTVAAGRHLLVVDVARARGSLGESGGYLITVSLPRAADSMALAHAARAGQLTLVRSTASNPPAVGDPNAYRPTPPPSGP